MVSVGGQDACVWDVLGGGKLLKRLRCHQKTIMSCHVAPDGGPPPVLEHGSFAARSGAGGRATAPRLLTGSLDGHVKVHELDDFSVASAKYPGPVLAVALSPDANALAVGTANKLLSIGGGLSRARTRWAAAAAAGIRVFTVGPRAEKSAAAARRGSWQYFIRGMNAKAAEGILRCRGCGVSGCRRTIAR